jgi:hypothetical protein
MGAAGRDIMPQRRSQLLAVVGEDLRVVPEAAISPLLGSKIGDENADLLL